MSFVMELENIERNLEKVVALLQLFAANYIDVTDEEARYELSTGRETMSTVYSAIQELATKYEADVNVLAQQYYAKAKEVAE